MPESFIEGLNNSKYLLLSSKSDKMHLQISLSLIIPNARITINNGIGNLTLGISTRKCPLFISLLIAIVRLGLELSSETERISIE